MRFLSSTVVYNRNVLVHGSSLVERYAKRLQRNGIVCFRDQNFIYFSQYKLKDIQKQSQLKTTIASPKIQRHQPKHKNNMDTTQNNVHVQLYDRVLTQQKDNKQEKT